jgi:glutamate dehydrogenase
MPATVDQVRTRIARLEDGERPRLQRFAEQLFEKADRAFLEAFDAEALVAMARGGLRFLDASGGEDPAVEVLQPSFQADGWEASYTVLRVALRDRPFIVDSLRAEIARHDLELYHLLHPIFRVQRGEDGRIAELAPRGSGGRQEAFEMFFLERIDDDERREALRASAERVLGDVVLATDDYPRLREKVHEVAEAMRETRRRTAQGRHRERGEEFEEYAAFLDWLDDDNFVFLGYREYDILEREDQRLLQADADSGLGILRKLGRSAYREPVPLSEIPEGLRERVTGGRPLTVTKTNAEATVHRPARMDYVGVKKLGSGLQVLGERRFLGLFTSKALSTPVEETPILRRKLRGVLDRDDAVPGSHDYKQIVAIFNSMPRSELFWSDAQELWRDIRTVMALEQERGVRLTVRPDPLGRGIGMMVIMPRERFNADVRTAIQRLLTRRLEAEHVDYNLAMGEDEAQVRFHFFFVTDFAPDQLDVPELEAEVAELTRTWGDHLRERLARKHGAGDGRKLAERWLPAMDERYQADVTPAQALRDVENLEALGERPVAVDLLTPQGERADEGVSLLKVYHRLDTLVLSDVLPMLENLGLRVLEQVAYPLHAAHGLHGIDVFRVQDARNRALDVRRDGDRLIRAVERLLAGGVDSDRLNRLVLAAGLTLREVALLRAYQMYYAQVNTSTSRSFVNDVLLANPESVRPLLRYLQTRFDPQLEGDRDAAMEEAEGEVQQALGSVATLPEDRVLRGLHDLMSATVRTNYFSGSPVIAFKLASQEVATLPEPRPLYEIGVSGYGVEGTHLRGGKVARGGIRWSDRPDDFRTEVLGLMKTQMTKNAVIVPVGSKGGFVVKHAPAGRDALREYVREQYRAFVGALLELTDNRVGETVEHPAGMVVHDGEDPYLVVAADKGTATFSDLANEVAAEHGFWLGDAFASGGSHGYDHKKEGITARSTWVSVERHFRELGVDPRSEPITVAGIGDMSGDVFGNGLLWSRTLRLRAAFNHLHVFLDPDPDPDAAHAERERLFGLPRSSWDDYDRDAISEGGGVHQRSAKRIPLSGPVREMLDVDAEALSGQDLVRAILRMPVDLLWNGGIGTYVKASSERNADVGDSANDPVRVDGAQLRCKVVGEGGNLGLTQLGRIEYARAGGRIDTDAIHNVGGVDMSDREVNIKILMQPLTASGELSQVQRNRLLHDMTDEVSELVLGDASSQSLAISLAERRSAGDPALVFSLQEYLQERGGLQPAVEFLPNAKERADRLRAGTGYVRPELAILLAYTKMGVYRRLLETEFPGDPHLLHLATSYFPTALQERFPAAIRTHPLRREIVATQATNRVVDLLGITFVHRTVRESGATPVEILRAGLMAMDLLDAQAFVARLERPADIDAATRYMAIDEMVRAVEGIVSWILMHDLAGDDLHRFHDTYKRPLARLRGVLPEILRGAEKRHLNRRVKRLIKAGLNEATATEVAVLDYLPASVGAVEVARARGVDLEEAATRFYAIGERLRLGWLRDRLTEIESDDKWETIALAGLVMELREAQQKLTSRYLAARSGDGKLSAEQFLAGVPKLLDRYDPALEEVDRDEAVDLARGTVLVRLLDQAVSGA